MNYEKLLQEVETIDLTFLDLDFCNTQKTFFQTLGAYKIEFVIHYEKTIKNHVEASYLDPEEGEVDFDVKSISDLCIYDSKSRLLELPDNIYNKAEQIVGNKIIDIIITY